MVPVKSIKELARGYDIDIKMLSVELDASPNTLRYTSESMIKNQDLKEAFIELYKEINETPELLAFNDSTGLHEYLEEPVVLHEELGERFIIVDLVVIDKYFNWLQRKVKY